ncbi:MAG: sigma-54-dependent Fis family transcriptional regulator, partial [Bacteroidetes bacterium]|nr:sigma-54-dependent Fis family transcriptional regulator [Bacteroidota bacterium]
MESTILIIDDEDNLRSLLARSIELEGYHVIQAKDGKSGLKQLAQENVQVVVSDVRLPDANGIELTAQIKKEFPDVEVIVLTAFGTIQDGVQAMKAGAFDYLTKGDHMVRVIPLIAKACERARLRQKVRLLESRVTERYGFGQILGNSSLLTRSVELAQKVAATDSTVLLSGETGTGKEVFAQAIHYESLRKSKPFIALNCSAFSRDLLESELFGHAE